MELSQLQTGLTKWFEVPGTSVQVKLRLPSRDELLKDHRLVVAKDGVGIQDMKWFQLVASNYIQDAKGITEQGVEIPYTLEVGLALMRSQLVGPFIDRILGAANEWYELGNL